MGDTTTNYEMFAELKGDKKGSDNMKGKLSESCHICGKHLEHLNNHILANHGEKVACQLCDQNLSFSHLREYILKEHCHKNVTKCSLCEQPKML